MKKGDKMIKIFQTKLHNPPKENGNCLSAVIASILEININQVPHFEDMNNDVWYENLNNWMKSIGLQLIELDPLSPLPKGFSIVTGVSPRNKNILHAVVFKDGKLVHDPHPSEAGIGKIHNIKIIAILEPKKFFNFLNRRKK